jgi:hypothetical protein
LISDGEKMALLYNIACCHSQQQDARSGLVALSGDSRGHCCGAERWQLISCCHHLSSSRCIIVCWFDLLWRAPSAACPARLAVTCHQLHCRQQFRKLQRQHILHLSSAAGSAAGC